MATNGVENRRLSIAFEFSMRIETLIGVVVLKGNSFRDVQNVKKHCHKNVTACWNGCESTLTSCGPDAPDRPSSTEALSDVLDRTLAARAAVRVI
jgi:hypothetical protein